MKKSIFILLAICLTVAACENKEPKNGNDDTITKILYVANFGPCGWGFFAAEGPPDPWTGEPTYSDTFFAENLPEIQDYYGGEVLVTYRHTGKEMSCFGSYSIINVIKIQRQ